jgi:peptide/nickel transport system permease protein
MLSYLSRRLLLLPITLFLIVLINFIIINLAPGEPTTTTEVNPQGTASRSDKEGSPQEVDAQYLQFREFYGLTLPILWNTWPWLSQQTVYKELEKLSQDKESMSVKAYTKLRVKMGDQARFVMPQLLSILRDEKQQDSFRWLAFLMLARGGTHQAILGPNLTPNEKKYNQITAKNNDFLRRMKINKPHSPTQWKTFVEKVTLWSESNEKILNYYPSTFEKIKLFFFETRFAKYMQRVVTLNFGTLRNDTNKTVISEVVKRFKYSFTLAILPMFITFALCQFFGFLMAIRQNRPTDLILNIIFLALYATPVFVVAPFLIEKVALHHTFPFTSIAIPISGFHSPDSTYNTLTSWQRLGDILAHILLPIIAIMYGSLAAQSRISRTAVLEVLRQDYVRTAHAKGLGAGTVYLRHVGRNASITIVTSIAGSLGIILGGSLIVESIFDINGFGRFFYEAILNRDYNVIMFSALAGSFLTLLSYLVADVAYTVLDPRVTLD